MKLSQMSFNAFYFIMPNVERPSVCSNNYLQRIYFELLHFRCSKKKKKVLTSENVSESMPSHFCLARKYLHQTVILN